MSVRITITLSDEERDILNNRIAKMEEITGVKYAQSKVAHDLLMRQLRA